MVSVFKTNVLLETEAQRLIRLISRKFPRLKVNFDLEDCDKILRVEGNDLPVGDIANSLIQMGFECDELED